MSRGARAEWVHGFRLSPCAEQDGAWTDVYGVRPSAGTQGSLQMSARPGFNHDPQQSRQFAVLLNHLFATRLHPEGRPYTLTEVAKATGMSVSYLSILRKGTIGAVAFQRVAALARFFHVPLGYFDQEGPPVDTMDDLVREALTKPLVRDVTLRAGKVGTVQRALVLQMLAHADQVLQELASSTEFRTPEPMMPSQVDDAA